jgi:hypothetical protein
MRRRPGQVVRHYLPVLVGAVALTLLVVLAPTVVPRSTSAAAPPSATSLVYPPGDAPGDPGAAASGVRCGKGVRQVPWSHYAPLCQPAFHGSNGGATSPGVTATTITVTSRFAATPGEQALFAQLAPGTFASEAQTVALERAYVRLFNRDFDLYGRKVVLKVFNGQGDFLQELSGGGQAAAEADAATARSLGAFADVSDTIFNTQPYDDALAAQHIVSVGGLFASADQLRAEAPYEYFPGPDCEKTAEATAALVGRAMAGMPAIYAGSPAMRREDRTFALISPGNAAYASCGQALVTDLAQRYGIHLQAWIRYDVSLDAITEAASQAADTVTQLERAGVTTVLCGCDPITPLFLAQDAQAQGYHPEWVTLDFGDTFSQLVSKASPNEWDHSISGGVAAVPVAQQEAVTAYRLAVGDPTAEPPPAYQYVYEPLLLLFDALQAAGPDLTPETFAAGLDSLPPSLPGGELGPWSFGPGTVDPAAGFQLLRWDASAISPVDDRPGTGLPCNGGVVVSFADPAASLPDHRQLSCPAVP